MDTAIADTITAFAKAAGTAKRLGFDTIELHAAHGYLIDQFFWAGTNHRTHRYGGATIGERARFAAEIIAAVRDAVGTESPIIIRLSQWKQQDCAARLADTPDRMAQWLQPLVDAGADMPHRSQRRFWKPECLKIAGKQGFNYAGWAKKFIGVATLSVGSVGLSGDFMAPFDAESSTIVGLDRLIERMERDEFDLIAAGRPLISVPQRLAKVRTGDAAGLRGFDASAFFELV